jgi:hypothetical protein
MGQMSVQYTPVQVLQAARRAEAEGKMDYALQFYRHLVENHGQTGEAQEAREGLFRIAEWRWGDQNPQQAPGRQPAAPQQPPPQHYANAHAAQHAPSDYAAEPPAHLPQVIAREAAAQAAHADGARDVVRYDRYRGAKVIALVVSVLGWIGVAAGVTVAVLAASGSFAAMSAGGLLGLPLGVLLGVPTGVVGLLLVIAGQTAAAIFENTNATLELLELGRDRLGA